MKKLFLFSFILSIIMFQSCENEKGPIEVAERTMKDEVSTFDVLPEHIKESLLHSTTLLKEAAKQGKGKTTEFGDILPDMAIKRKHKNGNTSYTLGIEKLEDGLYYDNIALQEYDDGSTEAFIIRYWPSLEWLEDFYGQENRYEHYTGILEVYDGEGAVKSRLDLVDGKLVDSKAFDTNSNKCIVHHQVTIGCVYSCWIHSIEITYVCGSSGGGSPSNGGGFGGNNFGDPGDGGVGGSGSGEGGEPGGGTINVTPVEDDDILLIPSCQSFEYANGSLIKAAGVSNIQNHFIAAGSDENGPYAAHIHLNITKSYFSMPKYWTNGAAANATADALLTANNMTKAWFLLNPKVKGSVLANQWEKNIRSAMRAIGGDWSRNPPFSIPNLAPYTEDWVWGKTDCTK